MPTIKTYVDVAATPEIVWRVLTDFAAYPKWNPVIRAANGSAREKERLRLSITLPRGGSHTIKPVVLRAIPAAELRWRTKWLIEGVLARERIFIIVPQGLKGIRLIQREQFSGALASLVFRFIEKETTESLQLINRALKKAAEAKH